MSKIYLISNQSYSFDRHKEAICGGIDLFQLRLKGVCDDEFYSMALKYQKICKECGVKFIINDNLNVAKEIGADGLHIGQDDLPYSFCKERFKGIIGISCHNIDEAKEAFRVGVDYIGFGSIYKTDTKDDAKIVGTEALKRVCKLRLGEVVAIGGIGLKNYKEVLRCGVDTLAISSEILKSSNPKEIIRKIKEI